jgi:hypothetical protein
LAVPESGPGVLEYVRNYIRRGDNAARRKLPSEALDSQLSQLFQMLGLVRYRPAEGAMLGLLPEGSPAGNETRAAASWALGLLHEGQPVPQVVAALTDRVAAVMPFHVEDSRVRRMCAVSLGRMKAKEAVPTLESFYRWMPTIDPVNNACGWAIEQITGERVPAPVDVPLLQRGWFLTTLD